MLEGGGKSGHIACNMFLGANTLVVLVTVSYRAGCDADMSMCLGQQCAYTCLVIGLLLLKVSLVVHSYRHSVLHMLVLNMHDAI